MKNINTVESYYYILKNHFGNGTHGGLIMRALLSELLQQFPRRIPASDLCASIRDYINIADGNELTVEKISRRFNYTPRYLSALFRRFMGIGLNQFITNEKMSRAKHLLDNTDLKIDDIGTSIGYCDGHNFSHAFKNYFGVSPSTYRRSSLGSR